MKSKLRACADGGHVKGPGGSKEDKIGPVMLSNGEYVLPADTVDIIGRELLDAIRLATHNFKDEKQKSLLRSKLGLADGGSFEDLLHKAASENAAKGAGIPPGATPTSEPVSPKAAARGGLLRFALPAYVAWDSANQTISDIKSGYNKHFSESIGVNPVVGAVINGLRNIGDSVLAGIPTRLGQGISGVINGDGFWKNFTAPTDREQFIQHRLDTEQQKPVQQEPPYVPPKSDQPGFVRYEPGSDMSRLLSERGIPVATQTSNPIVNNPSDLRKAMAEGGTTNFQNLGGGVFGRANDPKNPKQINEFVGVGNAGNKNLVHDEYTSLLKQKLDALDQQLSGAKNAANNAGGFYDRMADSVNERYNKLIEELKSYYKPAGYGNLARHLVQLELARAGELSALRGNYTNLTNSQVNKDLAQQRAMLDFEQGLLGALGQAQNKGEDSAKNAEEMLKAMKENEKELYGREKEGLSWLSDYADKTFNNDEDKVGYMRFAYAANAKNKDGKPVSAMNPQERAKYAEELRAMYELGKRANELTGTYSTQPNPPVDLRNMSIEDLLKGNVGFKDYFSSFLPGNDDRAVVLGTGDVIPVQKLVTMPNGKINRDYVRLINESVDAEKKKQSALRQQGK